MAARSSVLAWRTPWTEEAWRAPVHGVAESDMTEATENPHTQAPGHWPVAVCGLLGAGLTAGAVGQGARLHLHFQTLRLAHSTA